MKPKFLTVMILISLAIPGLAFGMASFDYPVVAPVVSFVMGDVTVKGVASETWDKVQAGRRLASGDTLRTGPASKAEISCATGKMRLYENTVIIVPEVVNEGDKKDIRSVTLDDGAGLFRIKKRGTQKGFEVKTSNIIAGVKGTLFGVMTKKARKMSRVAVYSGRVYVTDRSGTPATGIMLRRGQSMEVLEDTGFGETDDFDPGDVWNYWKKTLNPNPDLLGGMIPGQRTASSYGNGDDDDDVSCPPVVDNDGNVVVE